MNSLKIREIYFVGIGLLKSCDARLKRNLMVTRVDKKRAGIRIYNKSVINIKAVTTVNLMSSLLC